jgi:hypothetical protein
MAHIKLKYVNAFANRGRQDKRMRYYFRRRGTKAIPLPGLPGSEEFMAAYAAALAGLPDVAIGASERCLVLSTRSRWPTTGRTPGRSSRPTPRKTAGA